MTNDYRIEPVGTDRIWETAKQLVDVAIKAHQEMFGLDRETSRRLIQDAAEVAD